MDLVVGLCSLSRMQRRVTCVFIHLYTYKYKYKCRPEFKVNALPSTLDEVPTVPKVSRPGQIRSLPKSVPVQYAKTGILRLTEELPRLNNRLSSLRGHAKPDPQDDRRTLLALPDVSAPRHLSSTVEPRNQYNDLIGHTTVR